LPASCKQQDGETRACSDFDGATGSGLKLKCSTAANGDCTCESPTSVKVDESGVYTARGKQLDWVSGKADYCVSGTQLVVLPKVSMNMGEMGTLGFVMQSTFDKQ
jgi:hypothetical protein